MIESTAEIKPLVDIIMPTYNHERFIAEAIQSVLMQECSFNYRLIIGDDCSSDATYEICKGFKDDNPDKILLMKYPSNSGMASNYKSLFQASTAMYIAILEGDDYWTDKSKLQKQVTILESNPDLGLVHTNYLSLYENGDKKKGHLWEKPGINSGKVIGPAQTAEININPLTACFRADLAKKHVDFDFIIRNNLLTVDILLWGEICRRSEVCYLDEISGVYRVHSASITGKNEIASIERFSHTSYTLVTYLMNKYYTREEVKQAYISQHKIQLIYRYLLAGMHEKAKAELPNVTVYRSFKDRIICLSARHRQLIFLSHILAFIYQSGSAIKQFISRSIGLVK